MISDFIKSNASWMTPVLVAIAGGIISGIFYLLKKSGTNVKQSAKNVTNSKLNQVGHDQINEHIFGDTDGSHPSEPSV
jgi:hypothetical protein